MLIVIKVSFILVNFDMKNFVVILLFIFAAGCAPSKKVVNVTLDFSKWLPEEYGYNYKYIKINALKGYKLKKIEYQYDGWYEYQFIYKDGSVFAVSTNIINGTRLNMRNLLNIGINTLAVSRSLEPIDTIRHEGQQKGSVNYWLEYILGDVAVGYVDVPIEKKVYFDQMIRSIQRLNKK